MLRRAGGLPGVPSWSERIDGLALAMEFVEARPMRRRWHAGSLPDAFFDALEGILEGLEQRGLTHLDLRSPTNVLVTTTGAPAVVDFASATAIPLPGVARAWLERRALRKLRRRVERIARREPPPTLEEAAGETGALDLDLVVRGVRWRRYEAGASSDPTPVILLSDVGWGAGVFAEVLAGAERTGRRAIAFDLPGAGLSGRGRGRRTPSRIGRELDLLLRSLRLEQVDLLGLGLGGTVARWLASHRPRRVRTLVTLDAPISRLDPSLIDLVTAARRDLPRLRELVRSGPRGPSERAGAEGGRLLEAVPTEEIARPLRALPLRRRASDSLELDPRRLPLPRVPWLALFSDPNHPGLREGEHLPGVWVSLAEGCLTRPEILWESFEKLRVGEDQRS
jgi:pimeloyl-ACP methyl ester carboxylesterase